MGVGHQQKNIFRKSLDALGHLIYPKYCIVCSDELSSESMDICPFCMDDLHFTYFEQYTEPTPLDKLFWGRVQVEHTYSLLYYAQDTSTQKILQSLKYQNNEAIGERFGRFIGERIAQMEIASAPELIIPVPLHDKKLFKRGYNQSHAIARGLSEVLSLPVDTDFIAKTEQTVSQTKKGRFGRWDNVRSSFLIRSGFKIPKHILIIDDVITTGATLESIIQVILKNYPDIRISILSLALTK